MPPPPCRLFGYTAADGPTNMAIDEALLETAAVAGLASLRFYGWTTPTVSLGYFQTAASRLNDPLLADLPFVRRPTGGDALVHHHELTYALTLPGGTPWQKRGESWIQRMHGILRAALASLNIDARACCTGEEKRHGPFLCFLHQTPCDLLIGAHKVVGSAQRKSRGALLQHGAILLAQSPHTPGLPGLHELAGVAADDAFRDALAARVVAAFAADTGWQLTNTAWAEPAGSLADEKYTSALWNNKR